MKLYPRSKGAGNAPSDAKFVQPNQRKRPKLRAEPVKASQTKLGKSLLHEQVQRQAQQARWESQKSFTSSRGQSTQHESDPPAPEMDYPELSFSQQLQQRASQVDDDPQLAEMYWYSLGQCQNDAEALQSCQL